MGFALNLVGKTDVAEKLLGGTASGPIAVYVLVTQASNVVTYFTLNTSTLHGTVDISEPYVTDGAVYAGDSVITSVALSPDGATPYATVDFGPPGSGATIEMHPPVIGQAPKIERCQFTVQKTFGTASLNSALRDAIARGLTSTLADVTKMALTDTVAGTIKFYSGTMPASADDAPTGTLLATWAHTRSQFQAIAGVLTLAAPVSVTPSATGTATYLRMNATGGGVIQCSVGVSSGDVLISTTSLTSGVAFTVNTFDIAVG